MESILGEYQDEFGSNILITDEIFVIKNIYTTCSEYKTNLNAFVHSPVSGTPGNTHKANLVIQNDFIKKQK